MKPTLLVLAAGMGSRYRGLKQIDPVGPSGEVVLDYSVHDALASGFGKVVFVIRRDFEEEFRRIVVSRYEGKVEIGIAYQELNELPEGFSLPPEREKPWGTGHAVWCARNQIHEPFLMVNADDFYGREAFAVMADYLRGVIAGTPAHFSMVAYPLVNTLSEHGEVSRGICELSPEGKLLGVEECSGIRRGEDGVITGTDTHGVWRTFTGNEMVSMNFWGFTPAIFPMLGHLFTTFLMEGGLASAKSEFYIPSAVTSMMATGAAETSVLRSAGQWYGVTYREDRDAVAAAIGRMVREGLYPTPLMTLHS
ncbi:MAG: nucleotidyltransferase [Verrucomicrobia bacterium]|nr:nucleotidyltransferase [Verrucomicrobiota bacterium]